jgi:predicted AAA+ superfamily ATPase
MYQRDLAGIISRQLFKGKVIILFGPRRVGKTTLSKSILERNTNCRYLNCELLENKTALETTNSIALKNYLGNYSLIVLDEAQHITDIGRTLKVLVDTFPEIQIIATGSSSFELGNRLAEPLTWRSREYLLLPLSIRELLQTEDKIIVNANLDRILRFGLYPEVYGRPDEDAREELIQIASNYLYRDVLQFEQIKKPALLQNLLSALALQVGQEVSINELSRLLGETVPTIQRYIELLEKSFVIFRLRSFSRNLRKEIGKGQKLYFYDLGIRNALIRNFNTMQLRTDSGGLWENFCIVERMKSNIMNRRFVNSYFWRTYDQKEIDYIEEEGGHLSAFEFKFSNHRKPRLHSEFKKSYPDTEFTLVNTENFWAFLISE